LKRRKAIALFLTIAIAPLSWNSAAILTLLPFDQASPYVDKKERKQRDPNSTLFGVPSWMYGHMLSLFVWLVADDWCWFVLREKYCWLVAGVWFVLREKYCWLVADKPNE
jgi:hypothetical protein